MGAQRFLKRQERAEPCRAVELAEKLHSSFLPKYYQNSNLKGINSARKKKKLLASLLRPQEGESSEILPNACFFKVGLGNMSNNSYLCIFVLIYSIRYISLYFVFGLNK